MDSQLQFSADPDLDFNITYTQHAPNCTTRTIGNEAVRSTFPVIDANIQATADAEYYLLTHYIKPTGAMQTLVLPFSDFTTNLIGQPYDLSHVKDLTFVNMHPM